MPNKPENIFPVFQAGDPATKALDHKFLNNVGNSISNLSQRTIGQPGIQNGAGEFRPPILPGAEIRLGKVLEIQTATGDFKGPLGAVNVVKFEVIDALFEESVGQQDLTEQDASSTVIYAAAPTSFSAEADDFAWITKWSGQWWVLTGGGSGGGSEYIIFTVSDVLCDATEGRRLSVTPERIAPPCSTPSGIDTYGVLEVFDLKGCILSQYTDDELLGITGDAIYVGNLADEEYGCDQKWSLISLCHVGECG